MFMMVVTTVLTMKTVTNAGVGDQTDQMWHRGSRSEARWRDWQGGIAPLGCQEADGDVAFRLSCPQTDTASALMAPPSHSPAPPRPARSIKGVLM